MSQTPKFDVERKAFLSLAQQEAAGVGAPVSSAVHLFLALIGSSGKAASALEECCSIRYKEARFYVSLQIESPVYLLSDSVETGDSTKYILQMACVIAERGQHSSLHGLHVLMAMLRNPGAPCKLMKSLGADLDLLRNHVDYELSKLPSDQTAIDLNKALPEDPVSQPASSNVVEYFESERELLPSESDRKAIPVTHRIMDSLRNAHKDAMRRGHGEVHDVHLAIGLIFEALKTEQEFVKPRQNYIDHVLHYLESVANVRYTSVPGMNTPTAAQWPGFGSDVISVLENAFVEMKRLHSNVIDLNHVALAIIRKGDSEIRSCISDWSEMKGLASRLEQCVAWNNSRTRHTPPLAEQINLDCLDNYFLPVNAEQTFFSSSKNPITNLSTNSKYALWFAWERAGKHAQNDVNIDHLLGGVLSSKLDSQTSDFLREFGLTRTDFEEHCDFAIKRGVRRTVPDLRLHPLAKRVMMRANLIAEKLGKSFTEPEHILLSIFSEDRGMALPFFEYLNIDAKSAYQSLRARLEGV